MLSKETYMDERGRGELSLLTIYEYYLEKRDQSKKLLDFGEFSLVFHTAIKHGWITNSEGIPTRVTQEGILRKVIQYYNEKFNLST